MDLIGPEFDNPSPELARRKLIICSAPRTGSYELCRFLTAAGVGVPHEYFNATYACVAALRWGLVERPLADEDQLGRYIDALCRYRSQNGVFATKLQYGHIDRCLRNRHGPALFDGATVVHLFRPDVATQYASVRASLESGAWDFSERRTSTPMAHDRTDFDVFFKQAIRELNWLLGEDSGFRGLFALLGIRPIFATTDEFFREPAAFVRRIAAAVAVTVDEPALSQAIALSAAYGRDRARENAMSGLVEGFKRIAFQRGG
jgi:LPS sulfotransferase NodH